MNDLIEWLINYAFDHDIGCILTRGLQRDTPSSSCSEERLVIINMNWKYLNEIPFSLAHEIGHVINDDEGIHQFTATTSSKEEHQANCTAIDILFGYCNDNDIEISNPVVFCEKFGIPDNLEYVVSLKLKEIM